MNNSISVCLCTYKRPKMLRRCLESLLTQTLLPIEIIVTDNDKNQTGASVVSEFTTDAENKGVSLLYIVETEQNIALARNTCLQPANGKWVAFLDDDEFACEDWLQLLLETALKNSATGVWGPVKPVIPENFPQWMRHSDIFERPDLEDNSDITGQGLRTSNALVLYESLLLRTGPFDKALGKTGGSDSDLFYFLAEKGGVFFWSKKAFVSEDLEDKRASLKWHLVRSYRGGWGFSRNLKLQYGLVKALVVVGLYMLPSFIKAVITSLLCLKNPKLSLFYIACNLAGNLGKIGFFLCIKVEEYSG